MFDLFRSRDKAVRYLLGGLLGVVALSMVVTLIPGYGTPSGNQEQVVATVGKEPITVRQVQALMQNVIRSRRVPPEMVQHYVPQLIDQMITERAVAFQAERMGFKVSDEEVANAIRSMLPQMLGSADFDANMYSRYLAAQGLTIPEFERNIRTNLLLLKLQNIALEGSIVTPSEVEQEFHRRTDKVKVNYVAWTPKDLRSQVTVAPQEVEAYYNQNKQEYMTPETRSYNLILADEAKVGASIEVPEADLRTAYNQRIESYRTPERVKVRHILIKADPNNKDELAKAEAKAAGLLKQIKGGADFAKLARENSDDPGSKEKGGEYDFITHGQFVPEFEKVAFALKPKEISNLVKTQFGYHIIQLLDRQEAKVKPFEDVKNELATERRRERVFAMMQSNIEQARAELVKAPQSAAQIAAKYNLAYVNVQNAGRGAPIPEVGASPELDNTVAGMRAGEVSSVIQMGTNKLAVAAITAVQPPKPSTLPEVEARIRESLINKKVAQLSEQKARETTETLRKMKDSDLATIAKAIGGEVKSTQLFARDGAADGIGPGTYLTEAFDRPVGASVGPFAIGNQVFLAKVAEKQVADAAALAAGREQIVLGLKQKKAQERKELFEDGLMTQLIKEGKVKKNQDTIKRLVTSYQG